jgi:hypothetical protein
LRKSYESSAARMVPMARTRSSQLVKARRDRLLVEFTTRFDKGSVHGYVLDVGPRFFLVALVNDEMRFNGFQCFRLADMREIQVPARYASFAEAALKKRGERMPKKPRVRVANLPELLLTANESFPLVTIHREHADPDVCHIGRVVALNKSQVTLLEIGPDARWDSEPLQYSLSEITRIDFGCGYEEALHLVGGDPAVT